jgi:hypothetical protein
MTKRWFKERLYQYTIEGETARTQSTIGAGVSAIAG